MRHLMMLGLALVGMGLSLRKRWPRFSFGTFKAWRTLHTALGVATLVVAGIHTGFRMGANLNFVLMSSFVGLANYADALRDRRLGAALGHTLVFTVVSVSLELVLGLALALALDQSFRGRAAARASRNAARPAIEDEAADIGGPRVNCARARARGAVGIARDDESRERLLVGSGATRRAR